MGDERLQRGLMPVDFTLLRDCLKLPEGTRIVDVRVTGRDMATGRNSATFLLESDDFPATREGFPLPTVNAQFTTDDDGHAVFVDWEIPT